MLSINVILKEIKDVPINRMEELHQYIRSLIPASQPNDKAKKKILSYAGSFSDMKEEDFTDFLNQTQKIRAELFERNIHI